MRHCRREAKDTLAIASVEEEKNDAQHALAIARRDPRCAIHGLPKEWFPKELPPFTLSTLELRTAMLPAVHGDACSGRALDFMFRSAAHLSVFVKQEQTQCWSKVAHPPEPACSSTTPSAVATAPHLRQLTYVHQFDGATQRTRPLKFQNSENANVGKQRELVHVFMQSGVFAIYQLLPGEKVSQKPDRYPWICRATTMTETTTNFTIEAMLRQLPFTFEDQQAMASLCKDSGDVHLIFGMDRASPNWLAMKWIFAFILAYHPRSLSASAEPCNGHGSALAKSRSGHVKRTSAVLNSFARLTRDQRARQALSNTVDAQISQENVYVTQEPEPTDHKKWADSILAALYDDTEVWEM